MQKPRRGDVYYVNFGEVMGSEQGGIRPAVIIQNDIGNNHSPTTIVAPVTSRSKKPLPTHVRVDYGFDRPSCVLLEQIRTVSRQRLKGYWFSLDDDDMQRIDEALMISLGIHTVPER